MLATVDSLLPLSLLEAVRNVDTPSDQFDAEYVDELRNKRLGLSDTIYAQIKRHTEAARKGHRTSHEEAIALAKLIGRRPDAEAVFRAAGRYMARQSYRTISPITRQMMRLLPTADGAPTRVSAREEDLEPVPRGQRAARRQLSTRSTSRGRLRWASRRGAWGARTTKRRCASCCFAWSAALARWSMCGATRGERGAASGARTGARSTGWPE